MSKVGHLTVCFLMLFSMALLLHRDAVAETTQCTAIKSVPTTIKSPGIYCFTKNLTSSIMGGNAITITTSDVTIDMNGYTLKDWSNYGDTYGIRADNQNNITIRNGTIGQYRWGITFVGGRGHIVEDLFLDGNRLAGFNLVETKDAVIRNNRVVQRENAENSSFAVFLFRVSNVTIINNEIMIDISQYLTATGILAQYSRSIIEKNRITKNSTIPNDGNSGIATGIYYHAGVGGHLIDNRFGGPLDVGLFCETNKVTVRDNLVSREVLSPYTFGACVNAGNNH